MPRRKPLVLDYKLLAQLSQAGVRRMYLTKEAYDKLQGSLKGLLKPDPEELDKDETELAGVQLFSLDG